MQDTSEITYGPAEISAVEFSTEVGDLMMALAKAQSEMANPEFDALNYYGKGYSTLAEVRNVTVPPLARNGIATAQFPDFADDRVACLTILWHGNQYLKHTVTCRVSKTANEWIDGKKVAVLVRPEELTHQDKTGVFSYLRRVSLKAIAGVADEEDEAGEFTTKHDEDERGTTRSAQAQETRPSRSPARDRQAPPPPRERESTPQPSTTSEPLKQVGQLLRQYVTPIDHTGLRNALLYQVFGVDTPEQVKKLPVETITQGLPLFTQLCTQLPVSWQAESKPEAWITQQLQRFAATDAVPKGVDPETGEDLRDMPSGWLTEEEQREQREREEAAMLEHAGQD